jgi:hypothetical protein
VNKILGLLSIGIFFVLSLSCGKSIPVKRVNLPFNSSTINDTLIHSFINGVGIQVFVYDSCEYLIRGYHGGIAHKGNCKFCAARKAAEK